MQIKRNSPLMIPFILLLIAAGQFSIDMYLPSLPTMVTVLNTNASSIKLTIAIFLLGFGCSQLIYGPLSDHFGRRPVLLTGVTIAVISGIACTITSSIELFLLARLLQGLGIGAASVLARAIMRDSFDGTDLIRVAAYASAAWASIPVIAPILGAYIQIYFNWRMNFILLVTTAIILLGLVFYCLPETKTKEKEEQLSISNILKGYQSIIKHKLFLGNVCVMMIVYGITITFSIVSSFLLQSTLKLSPIYYSWMLLLVTLGFFSGSFLNSRLTKTYLPTKLVIIGFSMLCLSDLLMLGFALTGKVNLFVILAPMFLVFFSMGLIYPNCVAGCLSPFPNKAGSVSALYGFLVFIGGGLAGVIASHIPAQTQLPLSIIVLVESCIGFLIFIKLVLTEETELSEILLTTEKANSNLT